MPAPRIAELAISERPHRVVLENPGEPVPNPDGGWIESWDVIGTPWGRVSPASAADMERVVAGTVTALLPFLVVVPYVPGVTTLSRVSYHGRHFAVVGVRNLDERNVRLEIVCEERSAEEGGSGMTMSSEPTAPPPTPPAPAPTPAPPPTAPPSPTTPPPTRRVPRADADGGW